MPLGGLSVGSVDHGAQGQTDHGQKSDPLHRRLQDSRSQKRQSRGRNVPSHKAGHGQNHGSSAQRRDRRGLFMPARVSGMGQALDEGQGFRSARSRMLARVTTEVPLANLRAGEGVRGRFVLEEQWGLHHLLHARRPEKPRVGLRRGITNRAAKTTSSTRRRIDVSSEGGIPLGESRGESFAGTILVPPIPPRQEWTYGRKLEG